MEDLLIPIVAIVSIFVILPALIMRNGERKRAMELQHKSVVGSEVIQLAERMEKRIDALERILDVEAPGWREKHHEQR